MMIVVLAGLFLLDLYIVPGSVWLDGLVGFVSFDTCRKGLMYSFWVHWWVIPPMEDSGIQP